MTGQNWLKIAGTDRNGCKWLEMNGKGQNLLEIAVNGWNGWKWLTIPVNCCKCLDMDRNYDHDAGGSNWMALSQF